MKDTSKPKRSRQKSSSTCSCSSTAGRGFLPGAFLLSAFILGIPCVAHGQELRTCTSWPLDLPSGGPTCDHGGDDEYPPLVTFWGHTYEGDAFFWCLDKSGSMALDDRMASLKAEMTAAIGQLSRKNEFGIVAFSTNTAMWSSTPMPALEDNKVHAIAWVQGLEAEGWTCMEQAAVATIQLANLSSKRLRRIIIVGDGEPICEGQDTSAECLTNITAANFLRAPIDTVFVGSGAAGVGFMQQLATMNRGCARQVQ